MKDSICTLLLASLYTIQTILPSTHHLKYCTCRSGQTTWPNISLWGFSEWYHINFISDTKTNVLWRMRKSRLLVEATQQRPRLFFSCLMLSVGGNSPPPPLFCACLVLSIEGEMESTCCRRCSGCRAREAGEGAFGGEGGAENSETLRLGYIRLGGNPMGACLSLSALRTLCNPGDLARWVIVSLLHF